MLQGNAVDTSCKQMMQNDDLNMVVNYTANNYRNNCCEQGWKQYSKTILEQKTVTTILQRTCWNNHTATHICNKNIATKILLLKCCKTMLQVGAANNVAEQCCKQCCNKNGTRNAAKQCMLPTIPQKDTANKLENSTAKQCRKRAMQIIPQNYGCKSFCETNMNKYKQWHKQSCKQ